MKSPAIPIGAIAIAVTFATVGFFLGQHGAVPKQETSRASSPADPIGNPKPVEARKAEADLSDFTDPRAELDREPDPLARFKLALRNMEAWMNADPEGALSWLKSEQPSGRRDEVIRMALGQFAENDPKGAAEWATKNLAGAELNNTLILIAEPWAERNGLEAANWFFALPVTRERDAALETLLFAWAAEDPAAALNYLKKNPGSGDMAGMLRVAAFAGWAKSDPQGAVAASLLSSRTNNDPAQFANTLANWATIDLAGSSQWLLANVEGGEERALAVEELATIFAHQSPDAGLAWIGRLNAGAEREIAVNKLAEEWASADPAAAAQWAASQTMGALNEQSVGEILHNFLAEDSSAFEAWRAALPEGPLKDQAAKVGAMASDE